MIKLFFFVLASCLITGSVYGGIHMAAPAEKYTFGDTAISAPPEFLPAAELLSDTLRKIYRKNVPVTAGGSIKFSKKDELPPQGFSIVTGAKGIDISAKDLAGAKFASACLVRALGYRYFFPAPEWEVIPENPVASVALNVTEAPDYQSRSIWPGWGIWEDYRKSGGNDDMWKIFNFQGGISIQCQHVYGRFVKHCKKEFDEHPEYYGLRNGKRNSNKLCISNPGLRKLFTGYKLERLASRPKQQSVSAEPSDGGNWCECAECKKIGSISTRAVFLANETAKVVTAKYPGKMVGMYAYNQHSAAPEIDVHPGVVINIATEFIKGGHSVDELIAAWKAKKANIGIREYYFSGIAPASGRGTNTAYMKESLTRFFNNGARYVTAEAGDNWGAAGLGYYTGAHLMWNTANDPEALKDDFIKSAFPASAKPMKQFYDLLDGSNPKPLNSDLLGRMYRTLDEALKTASGKEKKRIETLVLYTRACELHLAYQNKPDLKNCLALFSFAASIRNTRMLHTYAMHRSPRRYLSKEITADKLKIDWKNIPAPSAENIRKFIADGIKNNKLIDFETKAFSDDLVLQKNPRGIHTIQAGNTRRKVTFYIWCDGKPFTLGVTGGLIKHYRNRGNVILQLIQVGGESETGELETLIQSDRSVPPDGVARKVTFKPKHSGLHKIVINDNGDMSNIKWPDNMAVALPVLNEKAPELNGTFYFYVPAGTAVLGFFARSARGTIQDPAGKNSFNLTKRNGYFHIRVKPEQCGKLWKINKMRGMVKFLTVPSHLSLRSTHFLIPKETKGN